MRAVYLKKHLDWRHFNSFCGRKYNEEEIPQFEFQYKPRKMLATAFQLTNLEGVTWYLQSGICTTPIGHLYHTGHIYHIGHLLGIWKTSMLNDVCTIHNFCSISRISNLILCLVVKVSVLITAGILRTDVVGRRLGQIGRDAATSKAISEKKVSWPV